jgi:hypothetical protein
MTLEELVEQFARNVAAQTDAIQRGDSRTGNKHAKRIRCTSTVFPGEEGRRNLAG